MVLWTTDKELFEIAKNELFVAVVGDVLDTLGYLKQFLPREIKPVADDMVVIGRAKTVLQADVGNIPASKTFAPKVEKPFGLMFDALDSLKEDEVYVCSGGSSEYAKWGGLMSTRATICKAAGAVVMGCHRDTNEIRRLNYPTFSAGSYAQDQGPRGRVVDYDCLIDFGGVEVNPGDIVFGDRDGVVIVPKLIEKEVFEGAIEKARGEKKVLKALQQGMSTVDAFDKFGIM